MAVYDFHCHSTVSDGTLPPGEVVRRAAERGVKVLALTDHDELGGLAEAAAVASEVGIRFVNGVEVSVNWGRHTLHIVGLGIDPTCAVLAEGLARIRGGRLDRARKMADSLAKAGIEGALEGSLPYADNPDMIGRAHFGRFLVDKGYAKNLQQVFKRYLTPGKPGYVAHEWATLTEAIEWIHAAGGLAVIAHPGRYDMGRKTLRELVEIFQRLGGDGIEVATSNHTTDQMAGFARWAEQLGLYASQGSDFHGTGHYGDLGLIQEMPSYVTPIWQPLGVTLPQDVVTPDLLN